jgi:DDE superfamily endonuclease
VRPLGQWPVNRGRCRDDNESPGHAGGRCLAGNARTGVAAGAAGPGALCLIGVDVSVVGLFAFTQAPWTFEAYSLAGGAGGLARAGSLRLPSCQHRPAEARRVARKLELHSTPKHGSWLNMAEIELSVLQQQCLDRRIPDEETRKHESAAWEKQRNAEQATIDWRFSVADAREKLKRLYPSLAS